MCQIMHFSQKISGNKEIQLLLEWTGRELIKVLTFTSENSPFARWGMKANRNVLSFKGYCDVRWQTEVKQVGLHIASWVPESVKSYGLAWGTEYLRSEGNSSPWRFRQQPLKWEASCKSWERRSREYRWRFLGQEGSCCSRIIPGIDTYAWLEASQIEKKKHITVLTGLFLYQASWLLH